MADGNNVVDQLLIEIGADYDKAFDSISKLQKHLKSFNSSLQNLANGGKKTKVVIDTSDAEKSLKSLETLGRKYVNKLAEVLNAEVKKKGTMQDLVGDLFKSVATADGNGDWNEIFGQVSTVASALERNLVGISESVSRTDIYDSLMAQIEELASGFIDLSESAETFSDAIEGAKEVKIPQSVEEFYDFFDGFDTNGPEFGWAFNDLLRKMEELEMSTWPAIQALHEYREELEALEDVSLDDGYDISKSNSPSMFYDTEKMEAYVTAVASTISGMRKVSKEERDKAYRDLFDDFRFNEQPSQEAQQVFENEQQAFRKIASSVSEAVTGVNELEEGIENTRDEAEKLNSALGSVATSFGGDNTFLNPFDFSQVGESLVSYVGGIKEQLANNEGWQNFVSNAKEAGARAYEEIKGHLEMLPEVIGYIGSAFGSFVLSIAGSGLKKLGGYILDIGKSAAKALNPVRLLSNGIKGLFDRIKNSRIVRALVYSWVNGTIKQITNAVKSGIGDSMKNLVQYSKSFDKSISDMRSALMMLRNAFAVAFKPIVEVVSPYITAFIKKLAQAINTIAQFIGALMGKKVVTQATEVWEDYADTLDKTSGSAKKLQNQLQGFDKLNNLTSNSGSGGGSGNGSGLSYEDMFTETEISAGVQSFVDMIKRAWENDGFFGIGEVARDIIIDRLNGINWTGVQSKAQKFGASVGSFLAGVLTPNNMGQTILGEIARSIAEIVNTAITTFNGWEQAFRTNGGWTNLGTNVADAINKFFKTVKWELAGETLGNIASGLTDAFVKASEDVKFEDIANEITGGIDSFFNTISENDVMSKLGTGLSNFAKGFCSALKKAFDDEEMWKDFGKSIIELIKNIDWPGIIATSGSVTFSFVKGILTMLGIGGDKPQHTADGGTSIEDDVKSEFEDIGGYAVDGFVVGLKNGVSTVAAAILPSFLKPAEDELEIGSPSKKFKEVGEWCVAGFVEGLEDKIEEIRKWFADLPGKVIEWFGEKGISIPFSFGDSDTSVDSSFLNNLGDFPSTLSLGINLVGNGWDVLLKVFGVKDEKVTKTFDTNGNAVSNWNSGLGYVWGVTGNEVIKKFTGNDKVSSVWNGLKSIWNTANSSAEKTFKGSDKLTSVWDGIKSIWNTGNSESKKTFSATLTTTFKKMWNALITAASLSFTGFNVVAKAMGITGMTSSIQSKLKKIGTFAKGGFPNVGDFFIANEAGPELIGTMNGKPAVASNNEITGIRDAIYDSSQQELQLLRQQNVLLTQLLQKEFGISSDDIFNSVRQSDKRYSNINGHSAFGY